MNQSERSIPSRTSIAGRLVLVSVALVVGPVSILLSYLVLLLRLSSDAFSGLITLVLVAVPPLMLMLEQLPYRSGKAISRGLLALRSGTATEEEIAQAYKAASRLPRDIFLLGVALWSLGGAVIGVVMSVLFEEFGIRQLVIMVVAAMAGGLSAMILHFFIFKRLLESPKSHLAERIEDPETRWAIVRPVPLAVKQLVCFTGLVLTSVIFAGLFALASQNRAAEAFAVREQQTFLQDALERGCCSSERSGTTLPLPVAATQFLLLDADANRVLAGDPSTLHERDRALLAGAATDSGDSTRFETAAAFSWRKLADGRLLVAVTPSSELRSGSAAGQKGFVLVLASTLLLSVLMVALLVGDVSAPARGLIQQAHQIASGNLRASAIVESDDEIGALASAFEVMTRSLRNTVGGVIKTAEGMDRATQSIVSASDAVSRITSEQLESVQHVHDSLDGVNQKATDIAGSAASVSASMEESSSSSLELSTAGVQLRESADLLFTNVEEISTSIEQMARSMESLQGNADALSLAWEEKSTHMEEMVASFRQVEDNAGNAQEMSRMVIDRAVSGQEKTTAAMEKMELISEETGELRSVIHDLGEKTSGIAGIVDVIDSVADETKLLALNAAIIAAQAGSQGGAFAVVSEHVKELAARVLDNTQEITAVVGGVRGQMERARDAIGRVIPRVSEGVETAAEARTSLEEITRTAEQSGQLVAQIVSAAREQDRVAAHALDLIEGVKNELANVRTAISEQKLANQAMLRSSNSLREVGQQVRGTAAEHATNVNQIRDGVEGASDASRAINEALENQSVSSGEILALMERLVDGTRGSEAVVQQMKSEMLELETEAQALRESVKRFQV